MALLRYVESIETFQKYLEEGGADITPERRGEVLSLIDELKGRLGTLRLIVVPEDASVLIDETPISSELYSNFSIRAGRHNIRVTAPGHLEFVDQIDISMRDVTEMTIELEPEPREDKPFYKKWWFWTVIGTVVAGGAAAGFYLLFSEDEQLGQGDWNVRLP